MTNTPDTILIGSVNSSRIVLESMIEAGMLPRYVFSLDEKWAEEVSGYYPLHNLAKKHGIPCFQFQKINSPECIQIIENIKPAYIFVIGLSQLVGREIMDNAAKGVIGFHPTPLPQMRGRAAMVWQVLLGIHETKCTMFFIDEGMDSGDIIAQEPYCIDEDDYAEDIHAKLCCAIKRLSQTVLSQIASGNVNRVPQNESQATYLLKRTPADGQIDWTLSIHEIHRLIRAVSRPYPGAFSMYDGKHKLIIWKAEIHKNTKYIGLLGQIANVQDNYFWVVCKDGLLKITDYQNIDNCKITVGHKLQ